MALVQSAWLSSIVSQSVLFHTLLADESGLAQQCLIHVVLFVNLINITCSSVQTLLQISLLPDVTTRTKHISLLYTLCDLMSLESSEARSAQVSTPYTQVSACVSVQFCCHIALSAVSMLHVRHLYSVYTL